MAVFDADTRNILGNKIVGVDNGSFFNKDWTFVCDGKKPVIDGKTRPNDGFFPSRDG